MEQVYFKKVEEVLQNFPSKRSKNYFANRKSYKTSIPALFESIIEEYIHCQSPMIDKEDFVKKMEDIFKNPSYLIAFGFDDNDYSLKEEVTKIIGEFKKRGLKQLKK